MTNFNLRGKSYPVWKNQKGYCCVSINENGYEKAYLLHRLAWELEHGPIPDGYELHHIDRNKANWSLDNLMMVDRQTHQELHRQDRRSTNINSKAGRDKEKKTNPNEP
jgi:hypothetical protein